MAPRAIAVVLALAAVVAPAAAQRPDDLRELAAWLETRTAELESGASAADARRIVAQARERLVERDVERRLADALLPGADGMVHATPEQLHAELEAAAARLRSFADASERPAPETPPDAAARLSRILDDPAFDVDPGRRGVLERYLRQLREMFGGLVSRMFTFASGHGTLMIWITGLAAAAALTFFIVKFIAPLFEAPVRTVRARRESARSEVEPDRDPRELLTLADRELKAGRAVRSIKLLEQAAILALIRRALLPGRPGLTDLESVGLLRDRGPAAVREDFEALTALHERLVYAGRSADAEHLVRARELAGRIVQPPEEQAA